MYLSRVFCIENFVLSRENVGEKVTFSLTFSVSVPTEPCNWSQARENACDQVVFDWLSRWREFSK